jgi:hypothetical protein
MLNPLDFKADASTGECFASLRAVADMNGVGKTTIYDFCRTMNWDTSQGLTPKMISKANAHYVVKGKVVAVSTMLKINQYGVQRFIFNAAGVALPETSSVLSLSDTNKAQKVIEGLLSLDMSLNETLKQKLEKSEIANGKLIDEVQRLSRRYKGLLKANDLLEDKHYKLEQKLKQLGNDELADATDALYKVLQRYK